MGLLMSLPHLQARAGSRCRQCRLGTEAGLGNVHIAVSANGQYVHADEAEESSSAVQRTHLLRVSRGGTFCSPLLAREQA